MSGRFSDGTWFKKLDELQRNNALNILLKFNYLTCFGAVT